MQIRIALGLALVLIAGCGGRPVLAPEELSPEASPPPGDAAPPGEPPLRSGCDAPAQLVAAGVSLDGAVSTLRASEGDVGSASSAAAPGWQGFANHNVFVRFLLEGDPEVSVHLALDRLLAIGERVALDPGAPAPGGLGIARGSGNDELRTTLGDLFSGWVTVTRLSERDFAATFCLLAWRSANSKASFTWARVSLPETTFSTAN